MDEHCSLRQQAIAMDEKATVEVGLALLWKELARGLCKVVDSFFSESRCFLLTSPTGASEVPLDERRLRILEAVLCGIGQKNVAFEMALAPSTVALNARLGLERFGASCKPSRVHPLVMLAANAAREQDAALVGSLSFITHAGEVLRVIAIPRPDRRLVGVLPPAELSVVRSLVEGQCYAEIAQRRGTSARTIANQVAAVFRRMRVSGRSELLLRLFFVDGVGREPTRKSLNLTLPPKSPRESRVPVRERPTQGVRADLSCVGSFK